MGQQYGPSGPPRPGEFYHSSNQGASRPRGHQLEEEDQSTPLQTDAANLHIWSFCGKIDQNR